MAIRAVVFDYGMVLSGPPSVEARRAMMRMTGFDEETFWKYYWAERHAYDEGKLDGLTFWRHIVRDAGLSDRLGEAEIAALNLWDARHWTVFNPAMIDWQARLKEQGIKTAVLSNMGDAVHLHLVREFEWLQRFDVLVWSYLLRVAKPEAAIYLHTLHELGVKAEEALFLDDKQENIDAALALGMKAILFVDENQLRDELIAQGFNAQLPLPELV
jgi:putative hydrolase of the HAD superfamily